ncbi:hypothetical protein KKC1_24180 [Calderihabitans maritimus]|uniref:Uncharacterized protein n=1 Tax=Calderihabitans maritimus TaxID=1246530 RepID=A0A1Z5HUR6_9FIRM|nr:hypothetical protein KKC1_24180 [Calderihabitans maritimus]
MIDNPNIAGFTTPINRLVKNNVYSGNTRVYPPRIPKGG